MLRIYAPSGRFSPSVFLLLPLLLAAAVGGAWIYQWLIDQIPFVYAHALLTFGFGALLAAGVASMLRLGRCRNVPLGLFLGAVVGLTAYLAAHYFDYLTDPHGARRHVSLAEYITYRVQHGWSTGRAGRPGLPIRGVLVYAVWLIEAGLIVGGGVVGGSTGAGRPYCESCGLWADRQICEFGVPGPTADVIGAVRSALSVHDLIAAARPGLGPSTTSLRYTLKGCPACDALAVLTVECRTDTQRRGKTRTETRTLQSNVLLSLTEAAELASADPMVVNDQ